MSHVWKFLLSFVIFVTVCYGGLVWFIDREVSQGVDKAVADIPGMTLTYSDLSVALSDHSVTLKDVAATLPGGQHMTAETLRITRFDQMNPVPHFVTAQAEGVVMKSTPDNLGSWAEVLNRMGVETVTGKISLDYEFDSVTNSLTVKTLDIEANDICDFRMNGIVDRVNLADLRMEKLLGLRFVTADLQYTDHSLVNSILRNSASAVGSDETQARDLISNELAAMADYAAREENSVAENGLRGFKRFVDNPGTISISARPADPVPYLYFFMGRDFYDNLRLLNISVTTDSSDDI